MKITLISFDEELYCLGIRILSSCLRQAGHEVQLIFLPPITNPKEKKFIFKYTKDLLRALLQQCKGSDILGMSLMTNQFILAMEVTKFLKNNHITAPIIWGGIEPTVEPEECIKIADIVCIGEAEAAIVELAGRIEQGKSFLDVKNFWFKDKGNIIRNEVRPLEQNLDKLSFPDYSCEDHFLGYGNTMESLTKEKLINFPGERFSAKNGKIRYPVMTSRGCPFACTYCCNSVYRKIYPGQKLLRWRTQEHVIKELCMVRDKLARLDMVFFVDDNFTGRANIDLQEFCSNYAKHIGVPFFAQVSPLTVDKEKLEILFKYGCIKITMGVETGSERVAAMYNRKHFHKAVPGAIKFIEEYRPQMSLPPTYQFIIDNPFESQEETLKTLHLAISLPRPWNNPIYSLMLFPGTELYDKAVQAQMIRDKYNQIYAKNWVEQSNPYLQLWIKLYRNNFPRIFLHFLIIPLIVKLGMSKPVSAVLRMKILKKWICI
ncbi:MAG: radical SAM protein [Candidatus Omnitrophota bacterium]